MDLIWRHISLEPMRCPECENIGLTLWPIQKTSFRFGGHVLSSALMLNMCQYCNVDNIYSCFLMTLTWLRCSPRPGCCSLSPEWGPAPRCALSPAAPAGRGSYHPSVHSESCCEASCHNLPDNIRSVTKCQQATSFKLIHYSNDLDNKSAATFLIGLQCINYAV